jgi:putative ABC transport system permease protein
MAMTDLTIIRRSMSSRLFSTITTAITVAVAVALMLVLLGMRKAARESFQRGSGNIHLIISAEPDPMSVVLNTIFYSRLPQQFILHDRFERLISAIPIKDDSGRLVSGYAIPVAQGDSYKGFAVLATTPEFLTAFQPQVGQPWTFTQGAPFTTDMQVVLGAVVARQTGLKMGDKVVLTHGSGDSRGAPAHVHDEFKFEVVGILAPSGTAHDRALIISLQSSWIVHAQDRLEKEHGAGDHHDHGDDHDHEHIATADDLTAADKKITAALLRLPAASNTSTPAVLQQVAFSLKREPGLTVAQPSAEITKLFGIVSNIDQVLLAMAGVVMVSSGIAIMLALYNSMEQRRRQIAVLRVLGCSRPRIFSLVMTESALLGAIGAFLGVLLAGAAQNLVAAIMKQRLGLVIEPALAMELVLAIIVASILLASFAGLVPAIMAYRTAVATNLKPVA